jgi:hypothetical protein
MIINFLMRKADSMLSTPGWVAPSMPVVSSFIWEPDLAAGALLALSREGHVDDLSVALDMQSGGGSGGAHFEGVGDLFFPVAVVYKAVVVGGRNGYFCGWCRGGILCGLALDAVVAFGYDRGTSIAVYHFCLKLEIIILSKASSS